MITVCKVLTDFEMIAHALKETNDFGKEIIEMQCWEINVDQVIMIEIMDLEAINLFVALLLATLNQESEKEVCLTHIL